MDTKLTLKLNQQVIEKAKIYAAHRKLSLSLIIENYLNSLTSEINDGNEIAISPFVKSMATGINIPADLNDKEAYGEFLEQKYK